MATGVDAGDPPNILLITTHDLGRYVGAYGRNVLTPRLDDLAEDGALFEQHFAATPHCAPARASLQTGLLPHNHGMMGHLQLPGSRRKHFYGWSIDDGVATLPSTLSEAGYDTHMVGFQHAARDPRSLGFEQVHDAGDNWAPEVAPVVDDVLAEHVTDDGPWFVEAGIANVHRPFDRGVDGPVENPPPGYDPIAPENVTLPAHLPDRQEVRENLADFHAAVYELDHYVGEILDSLADAGHAEETLVVFVADHGIPFPRAKASCFDAGAESALLARLPGRIDGGERYDELLSGVDLMPTLLDFAGIEPPAEADGRSYRPLVDESDERPYEPREQVFVETTWFSEYQPVRAIRTRTHKYLRNCWAPVNPATFDSHQFELDESEFLDTGRLRPEEELYDLRADPAEFENLADDPQHEAIRTDLAERLVARLEADEDPILDGPVAPKADYYNVFPGRE